MLHGGLSCVLHEYAYTHTHGYNLSLIMNSKANFKSIHKIYKTQVTNKLKTQKVTNFLGKTYTTLKIRTDVQSPMFLLLPPHDLVSQYCNN